MVKKLGNFDQKTIALVLTASETLWLKNENFGQKKLTFSGISTLDTTTFSIMTVSKMTLRIMTLGLATLRIITQNNDFQHNNSISALRKMTLSITIA